MGEEFCQVTHNSKNGSVSVVGQSYLGVLKDSQCCHMAYGKLTCLNPTYNLSSVNTIYHYKGIKLSSYY